MAGPGAWVGLKPNLNCNSWGCTYFRRHVHLHNWAVQLKKWHFSKCICRDWRMYLSKFTNVFVQKFISPIIQTALVFSSRCICMIELFNWNKWHCSKCVCPDFFQLWDRSVSLIWDFVLSKWENVFLQSFKLHLSSAESAYALQLEKMALLREKGIF